MVIHNKILELEHKMSSSNLFKTMSRNHFSLLNHIFTIKFICKNFIFVFNI